MGENAYPPYTPLHRKIISFNNKEFEVIYRYLTNDYDMYTSVMIEDAYRLQHFPLRQDMTAIDLGGHIGTVSLILASMGVKVYSVEILPENIEVFKWNLKENNLQDQVKIYQKAVASSSRQTIKAYYPDPKASRYHFFHHFLGWTKEGRSSKIERSINVETITIEDIFKENNLDHCHIVKVDLEGAEWDAFKDIPENILQSIDVVMGEVECKDVERDVDNAALLPLLKEHFVNASMIYQELDPSPYRAPCNIVGAHTNFIYIRKGLPIPIKW